MKRETIVVSCEVPTGAAIAARLPGSHFSDCYRVGVADPSRSALEHVLYIFADTPTWVSMLMSIRNRAVSLVGLKNLGRLGQFDRSKPAASYVAGDRVGIFSILSNTADEVLLGDDDKHLRVTLSLCKLAATADTPPGVALTTVVHIHNALGHLYMLPVAPMHKLIAPAMLARIGVRRKDVTG